MSRVAFTVPLILLLTVPVHAEILKFAFPDEKGLNFKWWPKVPSLPGWHHDQGSSQKYAVNALAPDGNTFANAETVLLAKANYKPRSPAIKTVAQLIEDDRKNTLEAVPGTRIAPLTDMKDMDGQVFVVRSFAPGKGAGNWEAVAYGEEGDYFLTFTISSRTQQGYQKNFKSFEALVRSYAKKLP
jgi:hypothetical protein